MPPPIIHPLPPTAALSAWSPRSFPTSLDKAQNPQSRAPGSLHQSIKIGTRNRSYLPTLLQWNKQRWPRQETEIPFQASLTNLLHCGLCTYHLSLSGAARCRGWAGLFHRSIPAWDFISLNIASDLACPPFWTLSPSGLRSWHCVVPMHQGSECAHRLDPQGSTLAHSL